MKNLISSFRIPQSFPHFASKMAAVIRPMAIYSVALALLLVSFAPLATVEAAGESNPRVRMTTSAGEIVVELYPDKAPASVKNFLQYVEDKHYAGTIFHRVIDGFMIQGGGFTGDFTKKDTREPIQNEADNGLKNLKYTLAMARTRDPHSATAQFFINTTDNDFLNFKGKNTAGWGYTVFGAVVEGKDIVDGMGKTPTGRGGPFPKDVPATAIVIEATEVLTTAKQED